MNYNNCFPLQIFPLKIHITLNRKQFPSDALVPKSHARGKAHCPSRVSLGSSFAVGDREVRVRFVFFARLFSFISQCPIPKPHAFRIVLVFSIYPFFYCLLGVRSAGSPSRTPRPTIKSGTVKENGMHSPHSLNNSC
ncbi:uncharacterized protein TM35_000252450 [Trypanosoma theileri]|uniref:Uncharacterized protein n=1 Tax=Trypanosoma theileri TaxID=67003 RepID=A0A1X0NRZ0_9TRYP|nr:uncharacterized protein TM35_000252450 [Trypanosoma theileri]ORC86949.1 hypothetical protein TM35_000252450 [Trypanosoma theileri]